MKFVGAIIILLFSMSANSASDTVCKMFFLDDIQTHEVETQNGKPRYFSMGRNTYESLKGKELDRYLGSIKNLVQFSERLEEISTFVPDKISSVPMEALFVANKLIPLIEDYLKVHDVEYSIMPLREGEKTRKSIIVISDKVSEKNPNGLNKLAAEISSQRMLLVIDPIELFYGYTHYNQSQGKHVEIAEYTDSYVMSFHLLLHSQRKDFDLKTVIGDGSLVKTDRDLLETLQDFRLSAKTQEGPIEVLNEVVPGVPMSREDSQDKFRREQEARLNKKLEAIKKGNSK